MSGLDPVGRKEIRDLIVEEAGAGRTVFFSSHILSDVEMLCDRVCILKQGEVVAAGSIDELVGTGMHSSEISIADPPDALADELAKHVERTQRIGKTLVVDVSGDDEVRAVLKLVLDSGARIDTVTPKRQTLEDIFVRKAQ
jgi:ABC-2 type transport system ATP-binding protein